MYRGLFLNVILRLRRFPPRSAGGSAAAALLSALLFAQSCGIEAYHYLPPVPSGSITSSMNQQAVINLPSISSSDFTHFALYYRIYISYSNRIGLSLSQNDLRDINQTLASDYAYLSSYTDTASTTTVNIASVMANRGYQPLYFELSFNNFSNIALTGGGEIRLNFPPSGSDPHLTSSSLGSAFLIRSNGGGAFNPRPSNRRFINTPELNDAANINQNVNADTVGPSGSGSTTRHAYTAIYIAAAGINEQAGYTPLYSIPAFVGVFLLPDRNS